MMEEKAGKPSLIVARALSYHLRARAVPNLRARGALDINYFVFFNDDVWLIVSGLWALLFFVFLPSS